VTIDFEATDEIIRRNLTAGKLDAADFLFA
jgi:hypothetical protein